MGSGLVSDAVSAFCASTALELPPVEQSHLLGAIPSVQRSGKHRMTCTNFDPIDSW